MARKRILATYEDKDGGAIECGINTEGQPYLDLIDCPYVDFSTEEDFDEFIRPILKLIEDEADPDYEMDSIPVGFISRIGLDWEQNVPNEFPSMYLSLKRQNGDIIYFMKEREDTACRVIMKDANAYKKAFRITNMHELARFTNLINRFCELAHNAKPLN